MSKLPQANANHDDAMRKKINAAVLARNLASAANNTRWNELIDHFRLREGWRPSYRHKAVTGQVSGWDTEWFYHLPFPFASVEWFDIGLLEPWQSMAQPLTPSVIDHTVEFSEIVSRIGFEFEVRADVMRIWGYLPKSYDNFPSVDECPMSP